MKRVTRGHSMLKEKLLVIIITLASAYSNAAPEEHALQRKVVDLEQKLRDCQQKKLSLLKQCDASGCLSRIETLQGNINNFEQAREKKHQEISRLQRTVAEHNRKLLASMSPENKKELKQLLREYTKLGRELCKYNELDNGRQPNANELFFI